MKHGVFGLMLTALLCVGCGDPLKEAQLIEELRVLGARVEVVGEPERATPEPGESADVSFLIADPSGEAPESVWAFEVCVAAATNRGIPFCEGAPLAEASQAVLSTTPPGVTLTVPEGDSLDDEARLLVHGVVCDDGTPELAPQVTDSTCDGAGLVQRVSLLVALGPGVANQNPDLDDATLTFDGEAWTAGNDCAVDGLPVVSADGATHSIALTLPEAAREEHQLAISGTVLEGLQISHFSNLGLLERRYSNVAPESPDLEKQLDWLAPADAPTAESGQFFFVVRDLRGGLSFLERRVCF